MCPKYKVSLKMGYLSLVESCLTITPIKGGYFLNRFIMKILSVDNNICSYFVLLYSKHFAENGSIITYII